VQAESAQSHNEESDYRKGKYCGCLSYRSLLLHATMVGIFPVWLYVFANKVSVENDGEI